MIYKPTTAYPCGCAVIPEHYVDETEEKECLYLSCSTLSSNDIIKTRLCINNGTYKYHFVSGLENGLSPTIERDNNVISITYKLDDNECDCDIERIKPENYSIVGSTATVSPLSIVNVGRDLSWRIRLYDKDDIHDTWIGYGFIQNSIESGDITVSNPYAYWKTATDGKYYKIKISPHTNIDNSFRISAQDSNNSRMISENKLIFKDKNAMYYLYHNGFIYEIKYFINYEIAEADGNDVSKDSYGNLLYSYVIVEKQADDSFSSGDSYTLYCNYIDSDEYYFSVKKTPTILLKDRFGREIKSGMSDYVSDSNTLNIQYSDFSIEGVYSQANGAVVNYYNFILEKRTDSQSEIIDQTGNIYASTIRYEYNNLISGEEYTLHLQVTDTNNITTSKELNIIPNYGSLTIPQIINASYFPKNYSCIVDFGKLISISGREQIRNGYSYKYVSDDGVVNEPSIDNPANACYLHSGNTITYTGIDGVGEFDLTLPFSVYMKVKIDSLAKKIMEISIGDKTWYLKWDKVRFVFGTTDNTTYKSYNPYGENLDNNLNVQLEHLNEEKSNNAFEPDATIPWIWQDDLPWDDDYFWHEESIVDDNWWEIILICDSNMMYGFFKNMLQDIGWTEGLEIEEGAVDNE